MLAIIDLVSVPHAPVLLHRVVALLARSDASEGLLIDATLGAGGHAAALLAGSAPGVSLLGLDRDPDALELAAQRLAEHGDRVVLQHGPYDELRDRVAALAAHRGPVLGVVYDLGVSSMQLDTAERGFSFRADAPLDMRMDPTAGATAADLVNTADGEDLRRLIATYGEDRMAGRIAAAILRARPLATTGELADVVRDAVPAAVRRGPTHPATRTFQALRIAVNAELDRFGASLPQALELLAPPGEGASSSPGGRVAVIAYHSLEDRIAKRAFADAARGCICPPELPICGCGRSPAVKVLTRGAEAPTEIEIAANPRARSARLRAVERMAP